LAATAFWTELVALCASEAKNRLTAALFEPADKCGFFFAGAVLVSLAMSP